MDGPSDEAAMIGLGRDERSPPSSVGGHLRQTRIALGQSIAEVARDIRIRQAYLAAIEAGRFDQLPGAAYTLGFIRTYAEHLGLEANEVVRRFKLETGAKVPATKLNFPSPLGESGVPGAAVLLIGAVIALIGYGIWYVSSSRYLDVAELTLPLPAHLRQMLPGEAAGPAIGTADGAQPVLPKVEVPIEAMGDHRAPAMTAVPGAVAAAPASPAAEPAPSPQPSPPASPPPGPGVSSAPVIPPAPVAAAAGDGQLAPTATPETSVPTAPSAQTAPFVPPAAPVEETGSDAAPGRVLLRATADAWVEIRDSVGRAVVFSRLMRPGDTFAVPDRPGLLLRTGNAGGLEAVIDGAPPRALGRPGTVRRNVALDAEALRADLTAVQ